MSTVFHVGDAVEVKRIIHGAPIETLGTQGTIRSIYEDGPDGIEMEVMFLVKIYGFDWWNYGPDELELVQEAPHENT